MSHMIYPPRAYGRECNLAISFAHQNDFLDITRNHTNPVYRRVVDSDTGQLNVKGYAIANNGSGGVVSMIFASSSTTFVSSDYGLTWSTYTSTPSVATAPADMAYGNGTYVTVAWAGSTPIRYSTDGGVNWTAVAYASYMKGIMYADSQFISCGSLNFYTSPDGITWTTRGPYGSGTQYWSRLCYNTSNGDYVAVANTSSTGVYAAKSTDNGATWTTYAAQSGYWRGVAYGNGTYVAVGNSGVVMTSSDGETWISRTPPTSGNFYDIKFGNGVFLACVHTSSDLYCVYVSEDGITWDACRTPPTYAFAITYDSVNSKFIIVGNSFRPWYYDGNKQCCFQTTDYAFTGPYTLAANKMSYNLADGSWQLGSSGTGNFTFGFWVQSQNSNTRLMLSNTDINVSPTYWRFVFTQSTSYALFENRVSGSTTWTVTSNPAVQNILDYPVYICIQRNGTNLSIYANGNLMKTQSSFTQTFAPGNGLYIGIPEWQNILDYSLAEYPISISDITYSETIRDVFPRRPVK